MTINRAKWRRGFAAASFIGTGPFFAAPGQRSVQRTSMANTSSAKKATRVIAKRTEINKSRRSRLRTSLVKVEDAFASGDRNQAVAALKAAEPVIMRAAQQGVLHPNAASRKVSRLTKRLTKLAQPA